MNRQGERKLGKSKLNELLIQLGITTTKKTGMQADMVWIDEMIEQRMQDAVDNTSDDVYEKIAKAHSFTCEGVLERYETEHLDKQQNVQDNTGMYPFTRDMSFLFYMGEKNSTTLTLMCCRSSYAAHE